MTIHGSKDEIPYGQLKYTQAELDVAVDKVKKDWKDVVITCNGLLNLQGSVESAIMSNLPVAIRDIKTERDTLRAQLEQASQNGLKLNGELLNTQTQLEKANHTIEALSGLICNINDTTRSRGFTTGPCDEGVIALAQNHDALQTQLEEAQKQCGIEKIYGMEKNHTATVFMNQVKKLQSQILQLTLVNHLMREALQRLRGIMVRAVDSPTHYC